MYPTGLKVAWKNGVDAGTADSVKPEFGSVGAVSLGYTFTVVEPSVLLDQMNSARCLGTFQSSREDQQIDTKKYLGKHTFPSVIASVFLRDINSRNLDTFASHSSSVLIILLIAKHARCQDKLIVWPDRRVCVSNNLHHAQPSKRFLVFSEARICLERRICHVWEVARLSARCPEEEGVDVAFESPWRRNRWDI